MDSLAGLPEIVSLGQGNPLDTLKSLDIFAKILLSLIPSAALSLSCPRASWDKSTLAALSPVIPPSWNRFGHFGRGPNMQLDSSPNIQQDSTSQLAFVELLRAKAERAALKAERAALEAERLHLQSQQLRLTYQPLESQGRETQVETAVWAVQPQFSATHDTVFTAWEEAKGRLHSFFTDAQGTSLTHLWRTRNLFFGTRQPGSLEGSFQVHFTLPGREHEPKTVELLQLSQGDALFAAVQVKIMSWMLCVDGLDNVDIFEEEIPWYDNIGWTSKADFPSTRLQVTDIDSDFNADWAEDASVEKVFGKNIFSRIDIRPGDIIRGISLPEVDDTQAAALDKVATSWWHRATTRAAEKLKQTFIGDLPNAEEGMLMLNGKDITRKAFDSAVKANWMSKRGKESEIVLLIERPQFIV